MGLPHQSIATIKSPQFINLSPLDINPLMSSCEIKVLYIGKNRNGSFISREVAEDMAKSLRGAPIVGYYRDKQEDFLDHGDQMVIDGEGIRFNCLTKPYGFVAPDAKVWFQDFDDLDELNNQNITRTYLMTTGYLWTGQFEQAKKVVEQGGRPQSMEIDEKTLKGKWATDYKNNMEFFIINDAIFSKLCILGEDIEPCFQGAAITAPDVSTSFTLDQNFKTTLFNMMNELKQVLKGGYMAEENKNVETEFSEGSNDKTEEVTSEKTDFNLEGASPENTSEQSDESNADDTSVDFAKDDKEKKDQEEDKKEEGSSEEDNKDDDDDEDTKKKYDLLSEEYNNLQQKYAALEKENKELKDFKLNVENEKKDALISEFFMLSDEDKKDVIENKANYTLDEIKSKLAVICFQKKVNFNLDDSSKNEDSMKDSKDTDVTTTFNIDQQEDLIPDWVKEVELNMNGNF